MYLTVNCDDNFAEKDKVSPKINKISVIFFKFPSVWILEVKTADMALLT